MHIFLSAIKRLFLIHRRAQYENTRFSANGQSASKMPENRGRKVNNSAWDNIVCLGPDGALFKKRNF
jgi:hypothetical protein